jgi:RNA polymerase sigma factor (TIGR02999 family)
MSGNEAVDITALLARWREGDRSAESALMNAVYPVLRSLARARLRRTSELTFSATEIANEAYARLARGDGIAYQDRGHFFAVAARAMRNFIVDHLRARGSDKRGGDLPLVSLDHADTDAGAAPHDLIDLRVDWLAVHEALLRLEGVDADCAQVVELKFFSGLTTEEIAAARGVSRSTVVRHWRFAKAWLTAELHLLR